MGLEWRRSENGDGGLVENWTGFGRFSCLHKVLSIMRSVDG